MSRVQFSNQVEQVLLPMDHSFTNGVKTAKVVRLDSYKNKLEQKKIQRKMTRQISSSKILISRENQKMNGTVFTCEICDRKCSNRGIYRSHMELHGPSSTLESSVALKNELELALYGKNFTRRRSKYRNKILSSPKTILKKHLSKTASLLSNILAKN